MNEDQLRGSRRTAVLAVVRPAKAMAMMAIELLSDGAAKARKVLEDSPARMTKKEYLSLQRQRLSRELYEGR